MKKRMLVAFLGMAMITSMLTGCNSDTSDEKEKTQESTEETAKASEKSEDNVEVEPVETKTVYVTPQWVQSALDGEQEGYEDILIAEVGYGPVEGLQKIQKLFSMEAMSAEQQDRHLPICGLVLKM